MVFLRGFSGVSGLEQDPDWLLHMADYDEDLLKNQFYVALEKRRPDLCSRAAEVRGVVSLCCWCGTLPSTGTLGGVCSASAPQL